MSTYTIEDALKLLGHSTRTAPNPWKEVDAAIDAHWLGDRFMIIKGQNKLPSPPPGLRWSGVLWPDWAVTQSVGMRPMLIGEDIEPEDECYSTHGNRSKTPFWDVFKPDPNNASVIRGEKNWLHNGCKPFRTKRPLVLPLPRTVAPPL